MRVFPALASIVLLWGCSSTPKRPELPRTLQEAVESSYRSDENQKRDVHRHPRETLEFFGIKPEMTVVEITPGAGWYMEILAPYLASEGTYIAAIFPEDAKAEYMQRLNEKTQSWLSNHPNVSKNAQVTRFDLESPQPLAPAGSADAVLTFRNAHNWIAQGREGVAFKLFFEALKPGGTLGVTDHRASGKSQAKKGYVSESDVIKIAERAGFKFVAKSEINANPKDTKNYADGVWTLPPSLRLGEKDREKYLAIGESDRMTLKFVKPE